MSPSSRSLNPGRAASAREVIAKSVNAAPSRSQWISSADLMSRISLYAAFAVDDGGRGRGELLVLIG